MILKLFDKSIIRKRTVWLPALSITAGCVLLAFPLVRSFHLDSAIMGGVLGGCIAVWLGSGRNARDRNVLWIIAAVYLAAVPLIIRDLATGCIDADGLAFWIFIPSFSIFFGYGLGRAGRYLFPVSGRIVSVTLFVMFLILGAVIAFFLFPQLFFYNHIFGYWPGAIYDESVTFPGRLILFRIISLTWTGIFWMIPHLKGSDRMIKGIFGLLLISLIISYTMMPQHNLVSPETSIRTSLGGHHQSEHFDFYYSKNHFNNSQIAFISRLHEFHLSELKDTLNVTWPENKRIASYLYGNERQMQRNTGARGVSFVPVWQRTPQLHMRKESVDQTLRHELVHVLAREFGNRTLNASWNIGLVEGLAVALAPASSARLTSDQLVVANDAFLDKEQINRLFSMTGFYRESSSVAYAVSGSFTAVLLEKYPVEWFKEAYEASSLELAYGDVMEEAVESWHEKLEQVSVSPDEKELARAIFSIPSLFEASCPRVYTGFEKHRDGWKRSMSEKDTAAALHHLEKAIDHEPDWNRGWSEWIRLKLEMRNTDDTFSIADILRKEKEMPEHAAITLLLADAGVLSGKTDDAFEIREKAMQDEDLPLSISKAWELRSDSIFWKKRAEILYMEHPDFAILDGVLSNLEQSESTAKADLILAFFSELFRRHSFPYGLESHISGEDAQRERLKTLISKVFNSPVNPHFSEAYRNMIYLAGERGVPISYGDLFQAHDWRPVQKKRLQEAVRFYEFSRSGRQTSDASETLLDTPFSASLPE